jgi:4-amino-4-deoxy-L-arabinose transferase-like glycosyltransferase
MLRLQSRPAHYAILAAAHLLLTLPNIGAHTLWDMDEGVNAEAGREMLESGNWITPYYNYEIRTAKPALLYWLQAASFWAFGVTEFAARLPAVICGLGSVWLTYELGRRMFSPSTGLLAGLILGTCVEFCLISHAATPDPPLILFLSAVFYCYWAGSEGGRRWWFVPCGALCGLAVLTKGPIGVAMPGLVIALHLAWNRQLGKLWDRQLLLGALAFVAVAAPWYLMVTLDTKGKWLQAFVMKENYDRFQNPADGHRGSPFYHVALLLVLFAPWSTFLIPSLSQAVRTARRTSDAEITDEASKYRFLIVWFLAYLVFFSLAATKLPNYVLPLYPAIAILTGRWLDQWRAGEVPVRPSLMGAAAAGCVLIGVLVIAALLLMAGTVTVPIHAKALGSMPALAPHAWLGVVPIFVGIWFWWQVRRGRPTEAIIAFGVGAVAFLGLASARVAGAMDEYKAPKYFAEQVGLRQTDRDIRIASFGWLRHSMVFYSRREVTRLYDPAAVDPFFSVPRPAYLIVPEDVWYDYRAPKLETPVKVIAKHYDFYAQMNILIVANLYAAPD